LRVSGYGEASCSQFPVAVIGIFRELN